MIRVFKRSLAILLVFVMVFGGSANIFAKTILTTEPSYNSVIEIMDWGAATTKLVLDLKEVVSPGSVTNETFTVYVKRTDVRVQQTPLEEGYRTITDVYLSDEAGNKTEGESQYVTLVLEIGPELSIASPLNYYNKQNVWITCDYVIKQEEEIKTAEKTITGLWIKAENKRIIPLVEKFQSDNITYKDDNFLEITMKYSHYKPESGKEKYPLIIWLHGGGEGGENPSIPLSANKACNLASDKIQAYFGGAYILVPQAPTKWMDDGSGESINGQSRYTKTLKYLIERYVVMNSQIDENRIYIGGCSNGGFMTLRMLIDYPNYFAAAFPICEGMKDGFISDKEIEKIKDIPMWFVCAATDTTLLPTEYTLPTYQRLIEAGAKSTYLSYYEKVQDTSGLYKKEDGTPYEYDGHWAWTYVYNNLVDKVIDGENISIMQWLSKQNNEKKRMETEKSQNKIKNTEAEKPKKADENTDIYARIGFDDETLKNIKPHTPVRRGMMVTVLGRLAEVDGNMTKQFSDVDEEMFYAKYIGWALENGIATGVQKDKFAPELPINRAQLAVMLDKYLNYCGTAVDDNSGTLNKLADLESIPAYARDSVLRLYYAGIMKADSAYHFNGRNIVTWAEMIEIVQRF